MDGPLVAIVGDINPQRQFNPPMKDPAKAKEAAEQLGAELARRGAKILVYGGPFLEADVVRGFVAGEPPKDGSIVKWYSEKNAPAPFAEEATHPSLFDTRLEKGADWVIAFYRSIARADALLLVGGDNATMVSGQVAIGTRMPIMALSDFGGAASRVWDTLSAGEDLPTREEINLMALPWGKGSAAASVSALFSQFERRRLGTAPRPATLVLTALLFLGAFALVPLVWGQNVFEVWMLFLATLAAGAAGATIRPMVDWLRGTKSIAVSMFATLVIGLVAGGVAGVLFVTAQMTADPNLAGPTKLAEYARHSMPYAFGVGLVAGLTSDAIFGRLLGLDVIRTAGIESISKRV